MSLTKKWPLLGEAKAWLDGDRSLWTLGTGEATRSDRTQRMAPRTEAAQRVSSICPYCAVGCGTNIYVKEGEITAVEGNPDSPINGGTLCPKGSAILDLTVNDQRLTEVLYRRPGGRVWETVSLDWAMERLAQRVKQTRDATMQLHDANGTLIRQCTGIASLGGACLDNEENYLIKKLFTGGMGVVWLENQARI
ncbi:MAG: dehydrogenase [Anaerolineales bacterium]|nr:dehydrogenase [Anaerolineales bacterium]MCB9128297.1 dehydrogenase [Ardenticatenales bacterium]MCB9172088.1 dehydrogenase [Ardenticatenales bacterium]